MLTDLKSASIDNKISMSNFDTYALLSYATNVGSDEPVHCAHILENSIGSVLVVPNFAYNPLQ